MGKVFLNMIFRVLSSINYFEIGKSIVLNIPIFMMNDFIKFESSSKFTFHNKSMFPNIFALSSPSFFDRNPNQNISEVVNLSTPTPSSVEFPLGGALQGTELHSISKTSIKMGNRFPAIQAWRTRNESRHNSIIDEEV